MKRKATRHASTLRQKTTMGSLIAAGLVIVAVALLAGLVLLRLAR